tara:strand:- start:786 stop:929 length:144 start_codon:yes stop_codon:yes gene_type:complete
MHEPLKQIKTKRSLEINWNIREFFAESALTSFFREIEDQRLSMDKID